MHNILIIIAGIVIFFIGAYLEHALASTFLTAMGGAMVGSGAVFLIRRPRA